MAVALPLVLLFWRRVLLFPDLLQGQTKMTGAVRVKGQPQGIADRFGLGVVDKHFSPHHHLRDIPKNPLGTEPGEEKDIGG